MLFSRWAETRRQYALQGVPVEPDTWRGDKEIIDSCAGHDKVHLCRSLQCGEDGQHFKEYSIAKEFGAEKFQLRGAELGAAEAGKTLWAWLWAARPSSAAKRPLEFCSKSELEEVVKCAGHQALVRQRPGLPVEPQPLYPVRCPSTHAPGRGLHQGQPCGSVVS